MQRLNPTGSLLQARPFIVRHDYIFALLCLLNVNMGVLDSGAAGGADTGDASPTPPSKNGISGLSIETLRVQGLLDEMASVFQEVG